MPPKHHIKFGSKVHVYACKWSLPKRKVHIVLFLLSPHSIIWKSAGKFFWRCVPTREASPFQRVLQWSWELKMWCSLKNVFPSQEIRNKGHHALHKMLHHETNSLGKLYVLHELIRGNETFENEETAEEKIEVRRKSGTFIRYVRTLNPLIPDHIPGVGG